MNRALIALAALSTPAAAETPRDAPSEIEVDREAPPPGRAELGFDGGGPIDGWAASIIGGWLERPITLRTDELASEPVARRQTVTLGGALAVADGFVVDAQLPLAHQTGARLSLLGQDRALDRWVARDLRIGGRARVFAHEQAATFVRGELSLPTGADSDFAGDASWTLAWHLIARLILPHGMIVAASAGIQIRGAEVLVVDRVSGNELHGRIGIVVPVPPVVPLWCVADQVKLTGEVVGILGDNVAGQRGPSPAEARLGVVTRPWPAIYVAVRGGVGLGDQIGAPLWRATIELGYATPTTLLHR